MLRCIFIKRKLYDYLDNGLSETDKIQVKEHLAVCPFCQRQSSQMSSLIDLAKNKKIPQPSEDFWHDFKTGLDRKLNSRLVPEFKFKPNLSYRLKPAFAYASILIVILAVGIHLYFYSQPSISTKSDLSLINEINLLEEVTQEVPLTHDEDAYIDELNLLYQLDPTLFQS